MTVIIAKIIKHHTFCLVLFVLQLINFVAKKLLLLYNTYHVMLICV